MRAVAILLALCLAGAARADLSAPKTCGTGASGGWTYTDAVPENVTAVVVETVMSR